MIATALTEMFGLQHPIILGPGDTSRISIDARPGGAYTM
jgi:hypothetical protein